MSNQNGKEIEVIFTEKNWAVTESYLWKISIKKGEEESQNHHPDYHSKQSPIIIRGAKCSINISNNYPTR